jgi:hypothetical protein
MLVAGEVEVVMLGRKHVYIIESLLDTLSRELGIP